MIRSLIIVSVLVYVAAAAVYHASETKQEKEVDSILRDIELKELEGLMLIASKRQWSESVCAQVSDSRKFNCAGGSPACIPIRHRCDAIIDCDDGSDEVGDECITKHAEDCKSSFKDKQDKGIEWFECRDNGMCLDKCRKCDGICDCLDQSDEKDCDPNEKNPRVCKEEAIVNMCP
ncbi:CD320 antigen-like [Saccoglossus kowalevskii]|uniref:Low-density lipoprotein receptor-related protein 1-like n=1 Tax=Saccoglossus kowalevskii TaxID=10224 RepID=A0ABM0GIU7_SACKO|nr:PREDICTED: low-density lipoprotein receptor-related protein 1-like [Saccoglossus kowalevskii]